MTKYIYYKYFLIYVSTVQGNTNLSIYLSSSKILTLNTMWLNTSLFPTTISSAVSYKSNTHTIEVICAVSSKVKSKSSCTFSPLQPHVGFAPHVFPSSLEKHLFIKATKANGLLHTDIKDGLGRVLPSLSAVQETHLKKMKREWIRQTFKCSSDAVSYLDTEQ